MFLLSTGGAVYSMFFAIRERKIILQAKGDIEINDQTLWNRSLPVRCFTWDSVSYISLSIPSRAPKGPVICIAGFYLNRGGYVRITNLDLPMYGNNGRKIYAILKEFLAEIGKRDKLSELKDFYDRF